MFVTLFTPTPSPQVDISTCPQPTFCKNIWNYFTRTETLGSGASSQVFKVIRKSDGEYFALKRMDRSFNDTQILFNQEIKFLSNVTHDNIINMEDSFYDNRYYYILLTLCRGNSLCNRLFSARHFTENIASRIIHDILEPIAWCHSRNIVHRDLKPENILLTTPAKNSELLIADWAEAIKINHSKLYNDHVGTLFYAAPECARVRQGWELKKIDSWSIGIITYILITGKFPYHGPNFRELTKNILTNELKDRPKWKSNTKISNQCKDFIESLLKKDSRSRMSAREALDHPWIRHYNE